MQYLPGELNEGAEKQLLLNQSIKLSIQSESSKPLQSKLNSEIHPDRASINPIIEEEFTDKDLQIAGKKTKKYLICQITTVVCLIIAIFFIFALPPFIHSLVKSLAIEKAILQADNQNLWAHFPGESGVEIVRNYTFFNFTNAEQVFLFNEKPKFLQIQGYKITELEDYLDIKYLDDGNKVSVRDWIYFHHRDDTRNLNETVNILNMGSLGYWYGLKNSRPSLILQQGLAMIFTNMELSLMPTLFGQGISAQFLTNFSVTYSSLLSPAGISPENSQFIWNDSIYGMSEKNNLVFWVDAAQDCLANGQFTFSTDSLYLKRYFTLSDSQLDFLMRSFNNYVDTLKSLLLENNYCEGIQMQECTGRYLSVRQLAQSFVTYNTPPVSSITPTETICTDNVTCNGSFPEISAFYKKKYLVWHPDADKNLTFAPEMVDNWFNYNRTTNTGLNYSTAQNCLLHVGNLDALYNNGTYYNQETNATLKAQYLSHIQNRFGLLSEQHTLVFWEWIQYLFKQFIRQNNTNNQKLGISTLFTKGLYQQFAYLEDNLQNTLLAKLLKGQTESINCETFFGKSMGIQQDKQKDICHNYPNFHQVEFFKQMIDVCQSKFHYQWSRLRLFGPSLTQIQQFCDPQTEKDTFGGMLHMFRVQLNDLYDCSMTPQRYCSDFEIAAKQWSSSMITTIIPQQLQHQLKVSTTYSSWDSNAKPIEYNHFRMKFTEQQRKIIPVFDDKSAYQLLTFDKWFSSPVVLKLLSSDMKQYLKKYMKYVSVFITLRGYTQQRTAYQLMFGYEDEFLAEIRDGYPPFGGDPSTPAVIAFNDPNITAEQANLNITLCTGKDDYNKLYQNYQINGQRYLTTNYTKFNGNHSYSEMLTPWAEKDYFYGTTAKMFAPNQFQSNNISLLIPNLQRYGSGLFTDGILEPRYGIDLYLEYMGESILANSTAPQSQNAKYYQTYEAVFNQTSVVGLPIFSTKNHFLNTTGNWLDLVEIWDQNQTIHYNATSKWDDTFLVVEVTSYVTQPYTGVSFQSTIYLQNNYYHQNDELFDYPTTVLLPVFTVYRSGNLTEDKALVIYEDLITGLGFISTIRTISIVLTILLIILLLIVSYKKNKFANKKSQIQQSIASEKSEIKEGKSSQLGISLQPQLKRVEEEDEDDF